MPDVTLVLDENTNGALESALKGMDYDVISASSLVDRGTPDMELIRVSTRAGRTIVTEDPQFSDADADRERAALDKMDADEVTDDGIPQHLGILIAREEDVDQHPSRVAAAIHSLIQHYGAEGLQNRVVYVSNWLDSMDE
jgi:hypothetical protein